MSVLSFDVNDVDEAREVGGRFFYDTSLSPVQPKVPFNYKLTVGRLGALTAGVLSFGCEMKIGVAAENLSYSVNLAVDGSFHMQVGPSGVTVDRTRAAVSGPTADVVARGWTGGTERAFLMKIDQHVLESELRQMIGREITNPIHFNPNLSLSSYRGTQWLHLTKLLINGLTTPDSMIWNPLVGAPLSRAIVSGFLVASEHQYRDLLDADVGPIRPAAIRRAIGIMEDRAHEPVTLTEVAELVGYTTRSLQYGFKKHVGVTPHEYLLRIRLDRAHADLVAGTPESTSVSDVATRWGFTHLSRFSAIYRKTYDRPPSKTLRMGS